MKLVDANLSSAKEFANRMMDGEVFYFTGRKCAYSPYEGRFYMKATGNSTDLLPLSLKAYTEMQIEAKWDDGIKEPVICWVRNIRGDERACSITEKRVALITSEMNGCYFDSDGAAWNCVTPITADDLYNGEL